jgi:NAD(P)-dependent dehydrogenase (short-subunit alcohol dehydrogenase family)
MGRVEGRVIIVTGAAQGLGATYARALAAEGGKICVSDLVSGASVVNEIREIGGEAIDVPADVSDEAACENMVAQTIKAFGKVDVLVNNAAIFTAVERKKFDEIPVEEWDKMHAVNVRGTWLCCKAAVPEMRRNGYGKIINISTSRVFQGVPFFLHYDSTKGAIIGITRGLSKELGEYNICVNAIAPGSTLSENVKKRTNWMGSGKAAQLSNRAIKREQLPEDLVGSVIFLASKESDFMTGQTLLIDGGISAH